MTQPDFRTPRRYTSPTDKRLLRECAAMSPDGVTPSKCWSPDGVYWVSTCATIQDIAGALVADGVPEAEYWHIVADGYSAQVRWHTEQAKIRMAAEYASKWHQRMMEYMEQAT